MGLNDLACRSLHTYGEDDPINRFVNIGALNGSTHIFECGTIVNGVGEVKAYINADGTCSFIDSNATAFSGLADVPHTYSGHALKVLTVGEDENCVRFSDDLKVKAIETDSLKTKSLDCDGLAVNGSFKVDLLEVNRLIQNGASENHFYGTTNMDKTKVNYLSCMDFNGGSGNITGNLNVEGDVCAHAMKVWNLDCLYKSKLGEVTGKVFTMDVLECDLHAQIGKLEVGDTLKVYGATTATSLTANSIINSGNLESNDVKSITGRFNHLTAETLEVDSIKTKSELVFGKLDYPQIFLPNEKAYIDVEMNLKGLRAYGYGFSPTQALDTILLKIKTEHKLHECDVKIGFKYYNTKETSPSVYKLGEVLYPKEDYILAVIKLSGNLPTAPYWMLSVDLVPF